MIHQRQELVADQRRPEQSRGHAPCPAQFRRQRDSRQIILEKALVLEQSREGALRRDGEQPADRVLEPEADAGAARQSLQREGKAGAKQGTAAKQQVHGETPCGDGGETIPRRKGSPGPSLKATPSLNDSRPA